MTARHLQPTMRDHESPTTAATDDVRDLAGMLTAMLGTPFPIGPEPHEILRHAVEETARLLRADGALVYLIEPRANDAVDSSRRAAGGGTTTSERRQPRNGARRRELRLADAAGIGDERTRATLGRLRLPVGDGFFGTAVKQQSAALTPDYLADERFRHRPGPDRVAREIGIRSMVVAPLVSAGESIGALGAYSAEQGRFTDGDVALVRALADHAAAAMANARLIEVIAQSRAEIARRGAAEQALREVAAGITAIRDTRELFQRTVEAAATLLNADGAIIDLFDEQTGRLRWAYDAGLEESAERSW